MKKSFLTLIVLSLAASAFAQSNAAASPTKPAAVETIEADDHGLISTQPSIPRLAPAVEALALHPAPASQKIIASPDVLAPTPMLPTAKVQVRKLPAADAARLAAAQRWEQTGTADALVGAGGVVEYPYGYSRPTITCAPYTSAL
ncbi:MAG: hypothetical protein IPJ18_18870 [Betaproteobacteria bacterium]|nr:hypothetical protein [Betaproteobacteria bacterium]